MSQRQRLKMVIIGLALMSGVAVPDRPANAFTAEDLHGKVERIAPPYPTLPGKVLCSCPQNGSLSRAVGYLNSYVNYHGTYTTIDVWCVYGAFRPSGEPAFTTACSDYRLLK